MVKRILTVLVAIVVLFSVSSVAVFAAEGDLVLTIESATIEKDATEATAAIYMVATSSVYDALWTVSGTLDYDADALTLDAIDMVDSSLATLSDVSTGAAGFYDNSAAQAGYSIAGGKNILKLTFTVKDTSVEGSYAINYVPDAVADGAGNEIVVEDILINAGYITVAGDDKGYEDLTADVVVATGNTVGTDLTDCQVGTGFYAKFNVPAALDSMKWSAKIGGVRKFSTEAIDLTPYEGIEVGADVVLYGAFTNGEHSENGFTAKKETETVTSPGIIVKSGETFYASADAFAE